jgi:hypothetical protein
LVFSTKQNQVKTKKHQNHRQTNSTEKNSKNEKKTKRFNAMSKKINENKRVEQKKEEVYYFQRS